MFAKHHHTKVQVLGGEEETITTEEEPEEAFAHTSKADHDSRDIGMGPDFGG
jgi:hypothetical protein